jgi:hypothetical protein
MSTIDLVKTPRKRMLLCYVVFGPNRVGYPFWRDGHTHGYHCIPSRLHQILTLEVFYELIEQLVTDGLIKQEQSKTMTNETGEAIMCWRSTKKGGRIAQALLGNSLEKARENHSQVSFSNLLLEVFGAPLLVTTGQNEDDTKT